MKVPGKYVIVSLDFGLGLVLGLGLGLGLGCGYCDHRSRRGGRGHVWWPPLRLPNARVSTPESKTERRRLAPIADADVAANEVKEKESVSILRVCCSESGAGNQLHFPLKSVRHKSLIGRLTKCVCECVCACLLCLLITERVQAFSSLSRIWIGRQRIFIYI